MDSELIKRPGSPPIPASPGRAYHPGQPRLNFSPERTPIEPSADDNVRAGLRRRPSHQTPIRRNSADFDQRPSSSFDNSRRPLRSRGDDGYYSSHEDEGRIPRSRHDDYRPHPDMRERSRPPRSYRNADGWERPPPSASKPYFEESRMDYQDRDLERGEYSPSPTKRPSTAESIDGYNYDAHKKRKVQTIDFKSLSREEQKQVLRLPWTEWMNSDFKNRMPLPHTSFP